MKYFVGSYENKVDIKSRVSLPSHFRDVLNIKKSNIFYIFPSPNKDCLEAGGQDLIDFIIHSIEEKRPMFSNEEETFNYIIANARPFSFDSTGRFVLPKNFQVLLKYRLRLCLLVAVVVSKYGIQIIIKQKTKIQGKIC